MDSTTLTAIIAAGATILGGISVEVIRKLLSRSSEKEDYATTIRNELREEIKELKSEISQLEKELDDSRKETFELMKEAIKYTAEIEKLKAALARAGFDSQEKDNDSSDASDTGPHT